MPMLITHHLPFAELVPGDADARLQRLREKGQALWARPDWVRYYAKGTATVEKLKLPDERIPFLRGQITLASAPKAVASYVLLNKAAQTEWDPTLDRVIEWARQGLHRVYQIPCATGRIPFVPDREFVYYEGIEEVPDGSIISVAESLDCEQIAPLGKALRGQLKFIMRSVVSLGPNRCRLEFLFQTDMAGRLPVGLVTKGAAKSMANELLHFGQRFGVA